MDQRDVISLITPVKTRVDPRSSIPPGMGYDFPTEIAAEFAPENRMYVDKIGFSIRTTLISNEDYIKNVEYVNKGMIHELTGALSGIEGS